MVVWFRWEFSLEKEFIGCGGGGGDFLKGLIWM